MSRNEKRGRRVFAVVAALCALGLAVTASAQVTTGALAGRAVVQTDGSVLPGVTIEALHVPTGTRYSAVTQENGRFNILNVRVGGPYTVTASVSPLGSYRADGAMAIDEPLIEGVVVTLGEGACPSTGLTETSTIITDLSYSFSGLKAGTYCVSIDPQREPNFSILRPGVWTFPVITQDVVSATVRVTQGEYKGMVNFGWDYQFQP